MAEQRVKPLNYFWILFIEAQESGPGLYLILFHTLLLENLLIEDLRDKTQGSGQNSSRARYKPSLSDHQAKSISRRKLVTLLETYQINFPPPPFHFSSNM